MRGYTLLEAGHRRQLRVVIIMGLLLAGVLICTGVAAGDSRVGGTVVIGPDDRVTDNVTATGGTVVIEGTVEGDVYAYGGTVRIAEEAEVTGIVRAYGGNVSIAGTVGENALGYGGTVILAPSGTIEGSYGAVAGTATVAGTVERDVNVVANSIRIAETAQVGGSLIYRGTLTDREGVVEGQIQAAKELSLLPSPTLVGAVANGLLFIATLLLGVGLLYLAPGFADVAVRTVGTTPGRTVATGLLAVVVTGIGIVGVAVTVVGLPIAVAATLLALVVAWVATIYGRFVVGALLIAYFGSTNRYLALLVGVVLVTVVGFIPVVGPLIQLGVFAIGAGIVTYGARNLYRQLTDQHGSPRTRQKL